MHKYTTDALHLSRRHPKLLATLEDGRLHSSGIAMLAPHHTDANCEELQSRATHKTPRAVTDVRTARSGRRTHQFAS